MEVDARVILATNHDLWVEVQQGRFRSDLYYRINVVNIELPPLRSRVGDVPLLAEHFLAKYQAPAGKQIRGFTQEAMEAMQAYPWPGNVRELENCIERAVVLCRDEQIGVKDLPPTLAQTAGQQLQGSRIALHQGMTLTDALAEPEKQIIRAALEANGGSRQKTAIQLDINRTTLYKKMKKYELMG
jgi:DNA-binding NtrC family response regulator